MSNVQTKEEKINHFLQVRNQLFEEAVIVGRNKNIFLQQYNNIIDKWKNHQTSIIIITIALFVILIFGILDGMSTALTIFTLGIINILVVLYCRFLNKAIKNSEEIYNKIIDKLYLVTVILVKEGVTISEIEEENQKMTEIIHKKYINE
jgi:phosphoglycerol transferase MdoB-like AlkP superfamily enzyme